MIIFKESATDDKYFDPSIGKEDPMKESASASTSLSQSTKG